MSGVYDHQSVERAVAVAAVAFSINSLEEATMERQRKMRANQRTRKENISTQPQLVPGGTRTRQDYRVEQAAFPSNRRGDHHLSSTRPGTTKETGFMHKQNGNASRLNLGGTEENSRERAQMEKINKRYENLKSSILAWENEKKVRTRIKMERRKSLLEQKKTRNQQYFDAKISRIDNTARGAREQLEEKRKKEESGIKEKARRTKTSGNVPVKCCFCFRM